MYFSAKLVGSELFLPPVAKVKVFIFLSGPLFSICVLDLYAIRKLGKTASF